MGASGTDVAREAADLVLLADHFASVVAGIELGRATFVNIRRFRTCSRWRDPRDRLRVGVRR